MQSEIQRIVSLLKQTFEKDAWHGPSVKEVLNKITPEQVFNRLPDTHSIIELVAHMTSWRIYVTKKLSGDDAYKVTEELNFPQNTNWTDTVKQLEESQCQLITAIEKFPEEKLTELVAGFRDPYTYYTLIHGIIHHDLYHTGQIMLIHKAMAKQTI
ncbi:MAG: DinB family protein [Cyclobacteriaceae bacterium]